MELIPGKMLAVRLERDQRLSLEDALHVARDVAAGLTAAHAVDVVHRDLKPGNIMLTTGSAGRRAVILDFGLARDPQQIGGDGKTAVGTLVGTPEYMAPEQITGAAVTLATDIYALGLILYEMLDGRRPFAGLSTTDSWMRRAREGPKALSGVVPGVRAHIDAAIEKCLWIDRLVALSDWNRTDRRDQRHRHAHRCAAQSAIMGDGCGGRGRGDYARRCRRVAALLAANPRRRGDAVVRRCAAGPG